VLCADGQRAAAAAAAAVAKTICRYFVLTGTVLRYYRSERDVARSPRGVVDVQVGLGVVDD
jgi:hypothetical protein